MHKNTEVNLSGEKWKVMFLPKVYKDKKPVRVGVFHDRKLIFVATKDEKGKTIPEEVLKDALTRAIIPIIIDIKKRENGIQ